VPLSPEELANRYLNMNFRARTKYTKERAPCSKIEPPVQDPGCSLEDVDSDSDCPLMNWVTDKGAPAKTEHFAKDDDFGK